MRGSVDAAHAIDGDFLDEQFGFNGGSVPNYMATGDSSTTEVSAVAIGLSMPRSVQRAGSGATTVRLI